MSVLKVNEITSTSTNLTILGNVGVEKSIMAGDNAHSLVVSKGIRLGFDYGLVTNSGKKLIKYDTSSKTTLIGGSANTGILLNGGNGEGVSIKPDGKIGIRTSQPICALDIVGEARSTITTRNSSGNTLVTKDFIDTYYPINRGRVSRCISGTMTWDEDHNYGHSDTTWYVQTTRGIVARVRDTTVGGEYTVTLPYPYNQYAGVFVANGHWYWEENYTGRIIVVQHSIDNITKSDGYQSSRAPLTDPGSFTISCFKQSDGARVRPILLNWQFRIL